MGLDELIDEIDRRFQYWRTETGEGFRRDRVAITKEEWERLRYLNDIRAQTVAEDVLEVLQNYRLKCGSYKGHLLSHLWGSDVVNDMMFEICNGIKGMK